jgi:hypothetical protein
MLVPDTLVQQRYRVVRLIGQGGMGAVYQAVDQRLGNVVALKQTIASDAALHATALRRAFEREARLLAGLRHPALPKVIDYFTDESGQFLVMEFIPGNDLAMMLATRGGPFPLEDVLRWAGQLLDVLDYMHNQQPPIVHRDIKPQNIKLTPRGEVVLLDFGLAKGLAAPAGATTSASLVGYTPQYAPLEQVQGTGIDPRSDLYALGATMHYLLTYTAPIDALTRASALIGQQPDPQRPARELQPNIPAAVDVVLRQALALDVGGMPASADALRAALAAALDLTNQTTTPQPQIERQLPPNIPAPPPATVVLAPARRHTGWALPLAGGLVALLLVAAILLLANRPTGQPPAPPAPATAGAPAIVQLIPTATLLGGAAPVATALATEPPAGTATAGLAVGQTALTRTSTTRPLWTAASGGQPVQERPQLFGGAQVTILALAPGAVQIRTAEGIEGWIQEPAEQALTADLSDIGMLGRFSVGAQVRVIQPHKIPVREEPRSTASQRGALLAAGQGGTVLDTLGDWLKIELADGSTGWVRWYYDGQLYVDLASAQAPPPFQRRLLVQPERLSGDDVRAVQERLTLLGYSIGQVDGVYGPDTEAAVKRFQTNNGLEVDGIVGSQTWARLFSPEARPFENE